MRSELSDPGRRVGGKPSRALHHHSRPQRGHRKPRHMTRGSGFTGVGKNSSKTALPYNVTVPTPRAFLAARLRMPRVRRDLGTSRPGPESQGPRANRRQSAKVQIRRRWLDLPSTRKCLGAARLLCGKLYMYALMLPRHDGSSPGARPSRDFMQSPLQLPLPPGAYQRSLSPSQAASPQQECPLEPWASRPSWPSAPRQRWP